MITLHLTLKAHPRIPVIIHAPDDETALKVLAVAAPDLRPTGAATLWGERAEYFKPKEGRGIYSGAVMYRGKVPHA